jgi:hypothetical protein
VGFSKLGHALIGPPEIPEAQEAVRLEIPVGHESEGKTRGWRLTSLSPPGLILAALRYP